MTHYLKRKPIKIISSFDTEKNETKQKVKYQEKRAREKLIINQVIKKIIELCCNCVIIGSEAIHSRFLIYMLWTSRRNISFRMNQVPLAKRK
jgi:hypothetical protein